MEYLRIECMGPVCNPPLSAPYSCGRYPIDLTTNFLNLQKTNQAKHFVLCNGWKLVEKVGPCCPRCIQFMLDEWGEIYGNQKAGTSWPYANQTEGS